MKWEFCLTVELLSPRAARAFQQLLADLHSYLIAANLFSSDEKMTFNNINKHIYLGLKVLPIRTLLFEVSKVALRAFGNMKIDDKPSSKTQLFIKCFFLKGSYVSR